MKPPNQVVMKLGITPLCLAGLACSGITATPFCQTLSGMTVENQSAVPSFRWPGGCGISRLVVRRLSNNQEVWSVSILDQRHFLPAPVRYGQDIQQPSAVATSAIALITGESYRVSIEVVADDDIDFGSASATFIH